MSDSGEWKGPVNTYCSTDRLMYELKMDVFEDIDDWGQWWRREENLEEEEDCSVDDKGEDGEGRVLYVDEKW